MNNQIAEFNRACAEWFTNNEYIDGFIENSCGIDIWDDALQRNVRFDPCRDANDRNKVLEKMVSDVTCRKNNDGSFTFGLSDGNTLDDAQNNFIIRRLGIAQVLGVSCE